MGQDAIESHVRFTQQDMDLFAAGSGDRSPLHTDSEFARRTPYGKRIVYGGLLTIALMGCVPRRARERTHTIRSTFNAPVDIDAEGTVQATPHPERRDAWDIRLHGDGSLLARVVIDSAPDTQLLAAAGESTRDPDPSRSHEYQPGAELQQLATRFGATGLDATLLNGIGWASFVVGNGKAGFAGLCAAVMLTSDLQVQRASGAAKGWVAASVPDERTERHVIEGVLSVPSTASFVAALIECFPIPLI